MNKISDEVPTWLKLGLYLALATYLTVALFHGFRRRVIVVGRRRTRGVDSFSRETNPFAYWCFMFWFAGLDLIFLFMVYELLAPQH
jgi:hypothetical protein